MERLVITMPISPYKKFSVGKMSTPILAQALATKLDAKYVLAVNQLDSYHERSLTDYLELLKQYDVEPDEYWIDSKHQEELKEKLQELIDLGYVYQAPRKILTCNCQRVEIPESNLSTINQNDACFYNNNDKYYCKTCNQECFIKETDSLIFNPTAIDTSNLTFFPTFINKDIKTFENNIHAHEVVISRQRDTGITFTYQGKDYNIDIDLLWGLYLSLFPNNDKIVICSNHQLYQLYMVSILEKCLSANKNTISLATPYLNKSKNNKEEELIDRVLSLKLFTLLNQKWSRKENIFDEGLLQYINTMSVPKKEMLYQVVMENESEKDLLKALKKVLFEDFNLQKANQKIKRRRRNV